MGRMDLLKILFSGVEEWNFWRSIFHDVEVDLSGIDFSCREFPGYDFSKALLCDVNLSFANLRNCIFDDADLEGADLTWSNLSLASCVHTCFERTQFYKTNLHDADLRFADLRNANLKCTNLTNANLEDTMVEGANFQMAIMKGVLL